MNEILNTILKDTFFLTQFKHRVKILKTNLLKTFFGGQADTEILSRHDLEWLESLPQSFYQQFNKDNVYKIFSDLETEIGKYPTLIMHLAFEPDESSLNQIGTFARKNFGSNLLLDIKLDPSLIAGAALVWKGIYKDYSLRTRINERKVVILDNFKQFLR